MSRSHVDRNECNSDTTTHEFDNLIESNYKYPSRENKVITTVYETQGYTKKHEKDVRRNIVVYEK